jgi:hypothetical protein
MEVGAVEALSLHFVLSPPEDGQRMGVPEGWGELSTAVWGASEFLYPQLQLQASYINCSGFSKKHFTSNCCCSRNNRIHNSFSCSHNNSLAAITASGLQSSVKL